MNYLGHKGVAVMLLPVILVGSQKINFNVVNTLFFDFMSLHKNHLFIMIASFIAYWVGSTLIDFIDFKIIKPLMPKYIEAEELQTYHYHRQWTHGLMLNVGLFIYCSFLAVTYSYYFYIGVWYFLGVFTHLLADMLTGSVPLFLYGKYYKLGSRIGITIFLPKSFHSFFTKKLPIVFDYCSFIFFGIGLYLIYYFHLYKIFL